jgi:hypothetical protein
MERVCEKKRRECESVRECEEGEWERERERERGERERRGEI